ncbi:MAG: hypothetical protein U0894_09770 [Pirellulales bacterium]
MESRRPMVPLLLLKQQHPQRGWGLLGGDLTAVTLGGGGSVWGSCEASMPDMNGWQTIEIAPQVMRRDSGGRERWLFAV